MVQQALLDCSSLLKYFFFKGSIPTCIEKDWKVRVELTLLESGPRFVITACDSSMEFADTEIASAFKFLDLDHNMHLGAAEIRHILVCMGELITDEEASPYILAFRNSFWCSGCHSVVGFVPHTSASLQDISELS